MKTLLLICALICAGAAYRMLKKPDSRRSGGAWLVISALLLVAAHFFSRNEFSDAMEAEKLRFQSDCKATGKALGLAIQERLPKAQSCLLIYPPEGSGGQTRIRLAREAFKTLLGNPVVEEAIKNPHVSASGRGVTWEELAVIIRAHPDCDAVILLYQPLPFDNLDNGLTGLHSCRKEAFSLIVTEPCDQGLAGFLEAGLIDLAVFKSNRELTSTLPDDETALAKRFIVLHKDNLEEMDKKFPELNIYDHNPQP